MQLSIVTLNHFKVELHNLMLPVDVLTSNNLLVCDSIQFIKPRATAE